MDFSEAIGTIMPLVKDGDKSVPFIISRHDDEWSVNYVSEPEKAEQFLDDVRANGYMGENSKDPYAVMFTGADFGRGSYASVYDRVFIARLYAEYNAIESGEVEYFGEAREYHALFNMLEENIGALSQEVTDYITQNDRPLAAIFDMLPMSLHSEHEFYDYDKVDEAIELIENKVAELIGHDEADLNKATQREFETMIEDGEIPTTPKRNLDGYEEKLSIQLAGRVLILGENPKTDVPYLVCLAKRDNPLNIEEYYNAAVTYDYLEAMRRFTDELDTLLIGLEQERAAFPTIQPTLTAADCVPNGLNEDLKGKLVVIKPEVLSPEYRSADHQLKIVQGGFGASPNARGNAVFCKDLYSDKETRFERYDIAGVIDPAKLPEWAKQKLAPVKEQIKPAPTKPKPAKQAELPQKKLGGDARPSILDDLDASVQEAAQLAERKGRPTKKRGDLEVD